MKKGYLILFGILVIEVLKYFTILYFIIADKYFVINDTIDTEKYISIGKDLMYIFCIPKFIYLISFYPLYLLLKPINKFLFGLLLIFPILIHDLFDVRKVFIFTNNINFKLGLAIVLYSILLIFVLKMLRKDFLNGATTK